MLVKGPFGGWFNIKMPSYQYRKSHCGDKTILRPSHLHNGISYTGKTTSLYVQFQGNALAGLSTIWNNLAARQATQPLNSWWSPFNSSPPGQNGHLFTDDIFRCISVNELFCILIKISRKFVHTGPSDDNPALVYIMAWCRIGNKPLSEPLPTRFTDAYMRH